jgi:hypothetical protein
LPGLTHAAIPFHPNPQRHSRSHLLLDPGTLNALSIFRSERHPSLMGIGTAKEGFSVYGLLNRCGTPMGKALLRQWCLAPVADLAVLADRHDTIEALMAAPDLAASVADVLRKVGARAGWGGGVLLRSCWRAPPSLVAGSSIAQPLPVPPFPAPYLPPNTAQVRDVPRLLARLQAQQGRPDAAPFRQLHASISQLLAVRRLAATLAPRAAAAAAAGVDAGSGAPSGAWPKGAGGGLSGDGISGFAGLGRGGGEEEAWGAGVGAASGFGGRGAEELFGRAGGGGLGAASGWGVASGAGGDDSLWGGVRATAVQQPPPLPPPKQQRPGGVRWGGGGAPAGETVWDRLAISSKLLTSITDDLLACERPGTCNLGRGRSRMSLTLLLPCCIRGPSHQVLPLPCLPPPPRPPRRPPGQGLLCDVIDLEGAAGGDDADATLVHRGVCSQLDALRDTFERLPDLLTRVGWWGRARLAALLRWRSTSRAAAARPTRLATCLSSQLSPPCAPHPS